MAQISDVINVNVSATSPGITQQGFGIPLILSTTANWVERTRSYTDISGVAADFASTTPEYLAAAVEFAQNPRPEQVIIGRLANKPTPQWDFVPVAVNNATYSVRIGATTVSYTADGSATLAEITAGVKAAIDALSLAITVTTPSNTSIHAVANSAGAWFDVQVTSDIGNLSCTQSQSDPGVSADLDAIFLENTSWYAVQCSWNSAAIVAVIAAWVEAHGRLFIAMTQDSACATHAVSGATDIMATLNAAAYKRTATWYHPASGGFIDAGVMGRCLPLDPGSETWAFKTAAGVPVYALNSTQRTNILAKKGNVYEQIAGRNVTNTGTVADGEFIDIIRFVDWVGARVGEEIFNDLADNDKIPFDDAGIAQLGGDVRGVLQEGVRVGGFVKGSTLVQTPKASASSGTDRTNRFLQGLSASANLTGAVHTAKVNINVTA